jgi:hypothetical protein
MQLWQDGPEIDEGENAPGRSLMKDDEFGVVRFGWSRRVRRLAVRGGRLLIGIGAASATYRGR